MAIRSYRNSVIEEKDNLDSKIVDLAALLFAHRASAVDTEEFRLIHDQLLIMIKYSRVLGERVSTMNKDPVHVIANYGGKCPIPLMFQSSMDSLCPGCRFYDAGCKYPSDGPDLLVFRAKDDDVNES